MQNNLRVWEPSRGILHDTDTNLNFIDLKEPFEVYAQPFLPGLKQKPADPVRHFRKVLLWSEYSKLLDYFTVDSSGKVKLLAKKDSGNRSHKFNEKMKYLLEHHASKSKIKKYMERVAEKNKMNYITQSEFYHSVYRMVKKHIQSKQKKLSS